MRHHSCRHKVSTTVVICEDHQKGAFVVLERSHLRPIPHMTEKRATGSILWWWEIILDLLLFHLFIMHQLLSEVKQIVSVCTGTLVFNTIFKLGRTTNKGSIQLEGLKNASDVNFMKSK